MGFTCENGQQQPDPAAGSLALSCSSTTAAVSTEACPAALRHEGLLVFVLGEPSCNLLATHGVHCSTQPYVCSAPLAAAPPPAATWCQRRAASKASPAFRGQASIAEWCCGTPAIWMHGGHTQFRAVRVGSKHRSYTHTHPLQPSPPVGQPGVTTEVASCTTGVALSVYTARWGAATALPDVARLIRIGCGVPQACALPPPPPPP